MASCPIKLPTHAGDKVTFEAHGERFQLKKMRSGGFFLARDVTSPPRSRWGNKKEICEDVAHVLEMGALPGGRGGF